MKKKTKKNKPGNVSFPKSPMEAGDFRLFPDEYSSGAASATECTGLVQVAPVDDDDMDSYEDIMPFRQQVVEKEEAGSNLPENIKNQQ